MHKTNPFWSTDKTVPLHGLGLSLELRLEGRSNKTPEMASSVISSTHHLVTGDQLSVEAHVFWTRVASNHARRRLNGATHVPEGYTDCDFCIRSVPLDSIMHTDSSPICVCCVVESALNPPEDKDDAKVWPPSYALTLLEESRFAEALRRPLRRWSDLTEEDLEDPDTGRIFGSRLVDRLTREPVELDDVGPAPECSGCRYTRALKWGDTCELCIEMDRRAAGYGADPLASRVW